MAAEEVDRVAAGAGGGVRGGWRTAGATATGGGPARCWRTGSRRYDERGDRQVRVGAEGVRAHPGDDGAGGRVVRRRARRDTDSRGAVRATAARAHEGHRRLTRHRLGAASPLDKGYAP